jgi:hypothetical protein
MKRYLAIAGILLLLIVIGVGIYFLIFGTRSSTVKPAGITGQIPNTGNQTVTTGGTLPGSGTNTSSSAQSTSVSTETILNYFVGSQGQVTTVETSGLVELIANGQSTYLSSIEIANVLSSAFSYDGK